MSEIYRAGIASIPRGQSQAALALGLTPAQAMRRIVLPQAVVRMIPPMANIWVSLFKDTSIVTAIGVAEMMTQARALAADTYRPMEIYTLVALLYFALTLPQSMLVNWLFGRWRVRT
jgi:polar amino acid transport system permease protein